MTKRCLVTIRFVLCLFLFSPVSIVMAETPTKIKLHKTKVSISPPNRKGMVTITGQPGAVEGASKAVGKTEVIKPGETFEIAGDGTFHTQVMAKSGDKIRVQAQNKAKKKSYGTFTVPIQQEIPVQDQPTTLTLTVMIVESQTGKLLASRPLEWPPVPSKQTGALPAQIAEQWLDQCLSHLQQKINTPTTATEKPEKKISP